MRDVVINQADIQKMADIIVEQFHPEKIILFGSYARGEATADSDVDLLVVDNCDPADCQRRAGRMRLALWGCRTPVDILVKTPARFEKEQALFWSVSAPAAKEGIVLHG